MTGPALNSITAGISTAFSRPWGLLKADPRACDRLWTMPNPLFSNAIAAIVAALCIRSRAPRSSGRWTTASRFWKISWEAFSAKASEKSLRAVQT
ncbi:Uncharacterised protein [Mycobacteroides abscessus subsp. abscessus]|nr:Uncharacterised protein [Mycobacteroides abscessus subsp. abscessus]